MCRLGRAGRGVVGSPAVLTRVQLLRAAICPVGCFVLKHEHSISPVLSGGPGKEPGSQRGASGPQGKPGHTLCSGSSLPGAGPSHRHLFLDRALCPHGVDSAAWLDERGIVCSSFAFLLLTSRRCQSARLICSAFEIVHFL